MSNTYAINTTRGREFEVEAELKAIGLTPWVPRILLSKNVKEKPEPIWYDRAYVPKLIFCVFPAVYWRDVAETKHVIGKPVTLSQRDIDGVPAHTKTWGEQAAEVPGLKRFKEAVEFEYADADRLRQNNEYQCQYKPGQALEMLGGNFEGFDAVFKDVIKRAHDEYAKLRVDINMFGGPTTVEVAPDQVRIAS